MENTTQTILDLIPGEQAPRRRKLLPWWIKTFIWIFMVLGGIAVLIIPYGFTGKPIQLAIYGIETYVVFSATGFVLLAVFLLKGLSAYALWTEKDAAIILAILDGSLGLLICLFLMIGYPFIDHIAGVKGGFRFEIILLIPYLLKLITIKSAWDKNARPA